MIRLSSFKRSKRGLLTLAAGGLAISLVGIMPAMAAENDPTLKLSLIDDDIVIVSAKYFAASSDLTLTATVEGGSGSTTMKTSSTGRALVGFELPDGYDGEITVKATAGSTTKSQSLEIEGDSPVAPTTTSTTATPATGAPVTTTPPATPASPAPAPTGGNGQWLSGMAIESDQSKAFEDWRGSPAEIISTYADSDDGNQRNLYTLDVTVNNWNGPLDLAVGGLVAGETWSAAANGAYDARWRESLTKMKAKRAGKGTTYIRFAHEMNGSWYPWKVVAGDEENFKKGWIRYRALQKEIFPEAKLVFNLNRESSGSGINWTKTFPGAQYVDVMGVDYYNQWPVALTKADFDSQMNETDGYGSPKGLAAHLAFAKSVGLPMSISEWSNSADWGDSAAYVQGMHDFIAANAGTGAGQIPYECLFTVSAGYSNNFTLYPVSRAPLASETYKKLF